MLDQLLQISRLCNITEQHCPNHDIIFKQNFLVSSLPFVFLSNDNMFRAVDEFSSREYINTRNLELCRYDRAFISSCIHITYMLGKDHALFKERSYQTVAYASMFVTFPNRVHIRHRGLHEIIYDNSSICLNPACRCNSNIRFDSDCHYDKISLKHSSVFEFQSLHPFFAQ
ncbi:hypothetical protein D3C81_1575440 [compost metagenome]